VDFEYSEPTLSATKMQRGERIIASVKVKNKGFYEAQETVQLYIRDLYGSTVRPVKELKGFKKISLLPNEEKVVAFEIDEESLAFYGSDLKRKAESGKFAVFIGASSDCQPFAEFELL
jgi:beta-glucosidase